MANSSKKSKNTKKVTQKKIEGANNKNIAGEVTGLGLIALGILFAIFLYFSYNSIFSEWSRLVVFGLFGSLGYLTPVLFITLGVLMIINISFSNRKNIILICTGVWFLLALIELCSSSRLFVASNSGYFQYLGQAFTQGLEKTGGGFVGAVISYPVEALFGKIPGIILYIALIAVIVLVITQISIADLFYKLKEIIIDAQSNAAESRRQREERKAFEIKQRASDVEKLYSDNFDDKDEIPERDLNNSEDQIIEDYFDAPKTPKHIEDNDIKLDIDNSSEELEMSGKFREKESYAETASVKPETSFEIKTESTSKFRDITLINTDYQKTGDFPSEYNGDTKLDIFGSGKGKSKQKTSADAVKPAKDDLIIRATPSNRGYYDSSVFETDVEDTSDNIADSYTESTVEQVTQTTIEDTVKTESYIPEYVPVNNYRDEDYAEESPEDKEAASESENVKREIVEEKPAEQSAPAKKKEYMLPKRLDLLDDAVASSYKGNGANDRAQILEQALKSFGIDVKVNNIVVGPSVTRYELLPAPGVKVSKILNLSNDIALNLAAPSVRIEAPIPGKAAIGIEVPNVERATVKFKELIDTPEFKKNKSSLYFALGKDITGKIIYGDLSKMPHLLVAGTTGSGKSVCINSIIFSILYRSSPEEVNFLMVDPKVVEMQKYNGIPHMRTRVVTDPKKAASMLNWVVNEMLNRYKDFADTNVREIDSYNEMRRRIGDKILPKLVVIIDEFADLMMASKNEVEDAVCRIAQLGRAAGIHLIVATQTPRAEVFTGMIKTNISSRIALTVSSGLDSRIILDRNGAETLLGRGDMLFQPIGQPTATRLQGCFITDEENTRVLNFLKNENYTSEDDPELENSLKEGVSAASSVSAVNEKKEDPASQEDELMQKAIELALEYESISTSMLQRRLKIGYARAARIVDQMELNEYVSPAEGNKPRQILITQEQYREKYHKDEV